MSKHTPGPWMAFYEPTLRRVRIGAGFASADTLFAGYAPDKKREQAKADASLAAAAPAMLAALELAAERLEISNYEGEEDGPLATIRAAIALAKGGAA